LARNKIDFEIDKSELRKLGKAINKFKKKKDTGVKKAIAEAGIMMENKAKQVITEERKVDTGRLRSATFQKRIDNGYGAELTSAAEGKAAPSKGTKSNTLSGEIAAVEYAKYINDGTSRTRGINYMEKAFKAGVNQFKVALLRYTGMRL